jgi:soluble lytic murein transglycosylase-like protein
VVSVEERIEEKLPKVFVAIAKAESNLNPKAYNPEWHKRGNCYGSYGLFQIGCLNYNGNPEDLFDIEKNIELAVKVYAEQGLKAWSVCKNGQVNCGL